MLTSHARKRLQQRGISSEQLEAVICFGEELYANNKAISYFNTKESEHLMLSEGFSSTFIDRCRNIYVICHDSLVISVCHCYK